MRNSSRWRADGGERRVSTIGGDLLYMPPILSQDFYDITLPLSFEFGYLVFVYKRVIFYDMTFC